MNSDWSCPSINAAFNECTLDQNRAGSFVDSACVVELFIRLDEARGLVIVNSDLRRPRDLDSTSRRNGIERQECKCVGVPLI